MKFGGVVGVVGPLVGPWGPLLANHGEAKGAKNGQVSIRGRLYRNLQGFMLEKCFSPRPRAHQGHETL